MKMVEMQYCVDIEGDLDYLSSRRHDPALESKCDISLQQKCHYGENMLKCSRARLLKLCMSEAQYRRRGLQLTVQSEALAGSLEAISKMGAVASGEVKGKMALRMMMW